MRNVTYVTSAARGVTAVANVFLAKKGRENQVRARNFDRITLQSNPSDDVVQSIECIPEFKMLAASLQRKF